MKTMKFNSYGNKYDLCIGVEEYYYGGGLAMQLYCVEGDFLEPFSSLTINVLDFLPGKNCALVDTNDFAQAKDLIEKYKLGKLRESDTCSKSYDEGNNRYYECFPEKYYAEIVFVHSENVVKSEFLFAPFDKKRVCVEKENTGENCDDP